MARPMTPAARSSPFAAADVGTVRHRTPGWLHRSGIAEVGIWRRDRPLASQPPMARSLSQGLTQ